MCLKTSRRIFRLSARYWLRFFGPIQGAAASAMKDGDPGNEAGSAVSTRTWSGFWTTAR